MTNPFQVVKDFENAVAKYTGAPYVVAVNSCTNALFLCLYYMHNNAKQFGVSSSITIPKHTYVGVPQVIQHAGLEVIFEDYQWSGLYQLKPLPIFDAARRFTSNMYNNVHNNLLPMFICTSHHWSKILGIQQGGCILHNDYDADTWFRHARFDGRTEGVAPKDDNVQIGWHMYMSPEIAAEGIVRLHHLPKNNPDLPNDNYPDLSQMDIFK